MSHDFSSSHGGDGSPGTGPCAGTGIMSYINDWDSTDQQWSTCSKSDFTNHYTAEGWGTSGCLVDISGTDYDLKFH